MSSPFYARIKADVLAIIRAVPSGRVVSFTDVGGHLDVMPRHVAHILATLDEMERATTPWHRAVRADGSMSTKPAEQAVLLAAEGAAEPIAVAALPHGVPKQGRPPDAPRPRRR